MGVVKSRKFKKPWQIRRTEAGKYVKGEWVEGVVHTVTIIANVQSAFSMSHAMMLPEGDRDKRFVWGSSEDYIYEPRSGPSPTSPDVLLYKGAEYEIRAVSPYYNFGEHYEFVAVRVKDSQEPRYEGKIQRNP